MKKIPTKEGFEHPTSGVIDCKINYSDINALS